jgi:predicted ester cyclase
MDFKTIGNEATQALNDRDFEKFATYHDPHVEFRQPGAQGNNRDELVKGLKALTDGIPDGRFRIETIIAEGDRAAAEGVFEGTHTQTLRLPGAPELPATGKRVALRQGLHFQFRDDKIISAHAYADRMELMEQLGLMPQAPAAARA